MKTYLTEYYIDGDQYGGELDALDWEHAQQIADARGKGETVIGELMCKIAAENFSHQQADEMCKRFAENGTLPHLDKESTP